MNQSYLKKWAIPGLFFLYVRLFQFQLTVNKCSIYKFLPMSGFEPRTSGIGSGRSTNCATTTATNFTSRFFFSRFGAKLLRLKIRSSLVIRHSQSVALIKLLPAVVKAPWFRLRPRVRIPSTPSILFQFILLKLYLSLLLE